MTDPMESVAGKELQATLDANFAEMMSENTPGRAPVDHFNKIANPVVDIAPELENTDLAAGTEGLNGELAQSDSTPGSLGEKIDTLIQTQIESNQIAKRGADASVEIADTNQKIATNSMV